MENHSEFAVLLRRYNEELEADKVIILETFPDVTECISYVMDKKYTASNALVTGDILIICDICAVTDYRRYYTNAYVVYGYLSAREFPPIHSIFNEYALDWFGAWEGENSEADDLMAYARVVNVEIKKIIETIIAVHEYLGVDSLVSNKIYDSAISAARKFINGYLNEDNLREIENIFVEANCAVENKHMYMNSCEYYAVLISKEIAQIMSRPENCYSFSMPIQFYANLVSYANTGKKSNASARLLRRREISHAVRRVIPLRDIMLYAVEFHDKNK